MQLAADVIQEKRVSLLVFPEGGRSHDGVLRPFKEGGAYIAIRAACRLCLPCCSEHALCCHMEQESYEAVRLRFAYSHQSRQQACH